MISVKDRLFHLSTAHTSYVFRVEPAGHLEHLRYGAKTTLNGQAEQALKQKHSSLPSATICYAPAYPNLSMELLRGEISTVGKGDCGDPFVEMVFADGSDTCDFIFDSFEITSATPVLSGLPSALPPAVGQANTLKITLKEANGRPVRLLLFYTVYEECDIIVRSTAVENTGSDPVLLKKLLSSQLDFEDSDYTLTNFHGSWSSEMHKSVTSCGGKTLANESRTGFSSNRANPFVMLARPDCTETSGEVYGSNLIYSGNHRETAQSGELERLRFSTGIHPDHFSWKLSEGDFFCSPQAVLSYSANGYETLSRHFHDFVRNYIIRGSWAHKSRPVLLNSWEAAYFDFNEEKLLSMAREGADLGVELFVLDDGWFGKRNSTKTSMGDWDYNPDKLPNGIGGLSEKIHDLGLLFGLWVEPEAVSVDSDLFRAHPDWTLSVPGQPNSEGRNTRLIDLCNPEVVEYLYQKLSSVFSCGVDYVKWDMNRNISDFYSPSLPSHLQGEVGHRYILGLYRLLEKLTERFPDILFESCASGGNRADFGMLCYMPQVWASDNSDAVSRMQIQTSYSYGYPLSVLGCHVSAVPNHQTYRNTPLSTRYEVAAYGLLGYELDPKRLSEEEKDDIRQQIIHYKGNRDWLMQAALYRLRSGEKGYYSLCLVSKDQARASILTFQELYRTGRPMYVLRTRGLNPAAVYHMQNRFCYTDALPMRGRMTSLTSGTSGRSTIRIAREPENYELYGDFLNESGIRLKSDFIGHNLDDDTRYYPDYATRIYDFTRQS